MTTIPAHLHRITDAAAIAGVARGTVYQWIENGTLTAHKYHGLLYVDPDQIPACRQRDRISRRVPDLPPGGLISTRKAASQTGLPLRTVQHYAQTGQVTAVKHLGRWYVDLQEIIEHTAPTTPHS